MAAELASVLAFSAIRNSDKVGLILFTEADRAIHPAEERPPARAARDPGNSVFPTAAVAARTSVAALDFANQILRRRAIVFLVSDFQSAADPDKALADLRRAMRLTNRRHDLVALHMQDPHEENRCRTWVCSPSRTPKPANWSNSTPADPEVRARFAEAAHDRTRKARRVVFVPRRWTRWRLDTARALSAGAATLFQKPRTEALHENELQFNLWRCTPDPLPSLSLVALNVFRSAPSRHRPSPSTPAAKPLRPPPRCPRRPSPCCAATTPSVIERGHPRHSRPSTFTFRPGSGCGWLAGGAAARRAWLRPVALDGVALPGLPPKLPYEIALERLEEARALMQPEHAREFSIAVSEIVRNYIEERFPRLRRTSHHGGIPPRLLDAGGFAARRASVEMLGRFSPPLRPRRSSPRWMLSVPRDGGHAPERHAFVRETGQAAPINLRRIQTHAVTPARLPARALPDSAGLCLPSNPPPCRQPAASTS